MWGGLRAVPRLTRVAAVRSASGLARTVPQPHGASAERAHPLTAGSIDTPQAFLKAISKTRRNLAESSSCVSAVGDDWAGMFALSSEKLKQAGVSPQERK